MDSESGEIRMTQLFTQNTKQHYILKVTAKDGGVSPQENTAVLHVQVRTTCGGNNFSFLL